MLFLLADGATARQTLQECPILESEDIRAALMYAIKCIEELRRLKAGPL